MKYLKFAAGILAASVLAGSLTGCGKSFSDELAENELEGYTSTEQTEKESDAKPQGPEFGQQMKTFAETADQWYMPDDQDGGQRYAYAITDLDQNGQMELMRYHQDWMPQCVDLDLWEINRDGTELTHLLEEPTHDFRLQANTDFNAILTCYYDRETNTRWMYVEDSLCDGCNINYDKAVAFLKDGAFNNYYLARKFSLRDDDMNETLLWTGADSAPITEEEYEDAFDTAFGGMEQQSIQIHWIKLPLAHAEQEQLLMAALTASASEFQVLTEAEKETLSLSPEKQLQVISENVELWKPEYDVYCSYAISDLDQNGRLELIFQSSYGSRCTGSMAIWEVSESGTGLDSICDWYFEPCIVLGSGDENPTEPISVYQDPERDVFWLVLHNGNGFDWATYYNEIDILALKNGTLESHKLASRTDKLDENDGVPVTCTGRDDMPITVEQYENMEETSFAGMEKYTMCLGSISISTLGEISRVSSMDTLTKLYKDFELIKN